MDVLIDMTTDYAKTRKQFGAPIGSFQVVQHRLVDMVIQREHSRSMLYMLTAKLAQGDADTAAAAAATKAAIGQRGRFIGGQAVHLHGAMGMTDELPIGDYFKRLMMIDISFGDAHYHRSRYSRLVDAAAASAEVPPRVA
jgi:alkylation response protein AidB-like acyl-CoA dehydrogenase